MSKRLEGRVAVITGAGSGIGYATALRLAAEGAKVVVADTNEESGNKVAKEVGGLFVKCDVTNEAQVANLYKVAFDTYNRIDIAFNNAGISPPDDDSILITGLDAWERVLKVNTTSVFLCCKAVIPYMQKAKKGSIINTASFVATMGAATSQIAYTASKGGVLAMSRELGVQFAREGIRVNAFLLALLTLRYYKSYLLKIKSAQHADLFIFLWADLLMHLKSQELWHF
jgi:NAD(P)-dependent dehydrogenase (short-subunit alcohol dehydrogenase family)